MAANGRPQFVQPLPGELAFDFQDHLVGRLENHAQHATVLCRCRTNVFIAASCLKCARCAPMGKSVSAGCCRWADICPGCGSADNHIPADGIEPRDRNVEEDQPRSEPVDHANDRALCDISEFIASESNLREALHRTFGLLAKIIPSAALALLLQDETSGLASIHALQTGSGHRAIEIDVRISLQGTAFWRAMDEQRPVLIADAQSELRKLPNLAARLEGKPISRFYALPLSTARRKLGLLVAGTVDSEALANGDVELMDCAASHLSIALDKALPFESAGQVHHELLRERDRLKLLLEINNHVVSMIEIDEFFRAASGSIRKFFENDVTGFWLLDDRSKRLNCAVLDFHWTRNPGVRFDIANLSDSLMQKMRTGMPVVETFAEFETQFPLAVTAPLRSESIVSFAHVPLVTRRGPIAVMSLGYRRTNAFSREDLELLVQVANQIALALDNALAYERLNNSRSHLEDQRLYLQSEIISESGFEDIIGRSDALRRVLEQVQIVASTDSTVIIHGETGTGKELIARAIHRRSSRSDKTFVRLNCAAIPSGLLESELFGHEKGAFTGALTQRRGRFELADQGTLFLDEIGDISIDLQPKLLRAIQEREFERIGSTRTIQVDVRLIAATHQNLQNMIREGTFREDLFYRLNVFPIQVAPLRERREDIPLLAEYFVSRYCRRMQRPIPSISRATMDALKAWDWPGNVRELENFMERAVILTSTDRLNAPLAQLASSRGRIAGVISFREGERNTIVAALKASRGKIAGKDGAAALLGLKRTTLLDKLRKLGIARSEFFSKFDDAVRASRFSPSQNRSRSSGRLDFDIPDEPSGSSGVSQCDEAPALRG